MDVAGREGLHAERFGELLKGGVSAHVASLVRSLQLDEEAVWPERRRKPRCARSGSGLPTPARAAREADEPLAELAEQLEVSAGGSGSAPSCGRVSFMRGREETAEVGVASRGLDEERDMRAYRSVTSAPVIGRTPNAFAACANSSEP